ncbi:MAG: acyltransferase family protein [Limisphaerales bacterium]
MTERPAPNAPPHDAGIANLASLGIVLVVLGHSTPTSLASTTSAAVAAYRGLLDGISLFHMPLFFFISGYLMSHSCAQRDGRAGPYGAFVLGKARRLLLPYWAISTFAFPLKAWMGGEAMRPVDFSIRDYLISLGVPWQNTIIFFWFLPTLFLVFLVAPGLLRAARTSSPTILTPLTLVLIAPGVLITPVFWNDPLNYRGAATHLGTFWLGLLWRERGPRLASAGHAVLGCSSLAAFALLWVAVYARILPETGPGQAVVRLAQAWTGVAAAYGLTRWATGLGLERVPWIHGHSYQIYLLSWFPQIFVKIALFRWLGIGFWPAVLLMFVGGLAIPVAVTHLVRLRFPALKPCLGMSS